MDISTTVWFALVITFSCVLLMVGFGFLGAAIDRNRGRLEQAEEIRRVLEKVRPGGH